MTHRFPIKEIALQAGLSTATVDRVLNKRPNVSPQTHRRVHDAMEELGRQEGQLAAKGRRLFIDVVMEAPARFGREVQLASEDVQKQLAPAALRTRFSIAETMTSVTCAATLDRIRKRGSHGVCLKARDTAELRSAISRLTDKRIPVVTIFTDITGSQKLAYAGLSNENAGRTAAYLMLKQLGPADRVVLTILSQLAFQGEEERYDGFRSELNRSRPDIEVLEASGGGGLNTATERAVAEKIQSAPKIAGVYSMGGGNQAVLKALERAGKTPSVFVAHDLDEDNLELLRGEKLTFVLHHDLRSDMRTAFRHIMAFHGIGPEPAASLSDIQIVTPVNIPMAFK
ncbi:LacI family DNA-binding transcriptional regulator [uncultured Roseibium sp.]|uniref:LacI family DNA-binding transcriptional regulator n=1 Tax=uncultured Roseibium sp. TaxID=1936171 RepID=UPI0026178713|nr:LacI family DNA-binding transcriptional regulator [uncultured Roseibium sp.]